MVVLFHYRASNPCITSIPLKGFLLLHQLAVSSTLVGFCFLLTEGNERLRCSVRMWFISFYKYGFTRIHSI